MSESKFSPASHQIAPTVEKSENKLKDRATILEGMAGGFNSAIESLNGKMGATTDVATKKMLAQEIARTSSLMTRCLDLVELEKQKNSGKALEAGLQSGPQKAAERVNASAGLEIERQIGEVLKQVKEIMDLGAKPEVSIKVGKDNKVTASVEAVSLDGSKKSLGDLRAEKTLGASSKEISPLAAGAAAERPGTSPKSASAQVVVAPQQVQLGA